jgi:translation initiation factor 2 alpha subunit (eIF-2alpha)
VIRTVPAGFYPFATDGIFGIRHAILAAIRQARQYIYLENQYIWAPKWWMR